MQEQSLFIAALETEDAAERTAFLDQACAGDPELRQRLDRLLEQHRRAGGFLETPAVACVAAAIAAVAGSGDTEPPEDEPDDQALDFLLPADQPDLLGRLGHYQVLEVVGKGGMGIVLRAFDEQLRRVVAIKVMAPALAANATARKRFVREAQAAAAVRNDHVIGIHTVEEASVPPYLVMEFISGQSLQERLDQTGALGLKEILRIGMQTALGLAAAHQQGLIHRDVKPANILLENGVERVKITDFGMARAAADASLTQCGVVAGTPQYMSPEQARGEPVDARTDLFSLGSVLYAMGTGRAPFRASGSLAVLKRVCEETPTPIREANPEIPDWLVAIIEKLHAKDPAERFQSAAEVAELLGRYLAQVQQPSLQPASGGRQPPVGTGVPLATEGLRPPLAKRRWAIAAAAVVLLLGGLSLTEATGLSNLRATVIRIFTPDGTLVVEVDDPDVKVTIEGDGGLVITGAGLEEIRLRPGSYKVQADKDGKRVPLERELVSIAKGGREVVKVKLEAPPAEASAKAEKGAFVLLAAGKERKFNTLAEAVQGASDGDTIEIRGNGPFVTQPVSFGRRSLTIRAATGFRPVIKGTVGQGGEKSSYLLRSQGPLVLEGLELHMTGPLGSKTVHSELGLLHVVNCRFVLNGGHSIGVGAPACTVRNCEFVGALKGGHHVVANLSNNGKMILENNLFSGPSQHALDLNWERRDLQQVAIHMNNNTVATRASIVHGLIIVPESAEQDAAPDRPSVQMHVSANLFDPIDPTGCTFSLLLPPDWYRKEAKPLSVEDAERLLPRLMAWREERNLYRKGLTIQTIWRKKSPIGQERAEVDEPLPVGRTLADWQRLWKTGDSGSMQGIIRYEGGDVLAKMEATPEQITAEDFRLRPDSPGYRADKDGKDLGADVDLVGPGLAYERWKKTPEYQQWLKDTGQIKPEAKAFALMGGKGVAERKFDTLAEAVQGANDGDTIEIRGNGPFETAPIDLQVKALTIRAGEGYRPHLRHQPTDPKSIEPLLKTEGPLVLEGLILERGPNPGAKRWLNNGAVVNVHGAPFRLAGCRLVGHRLHGGLRLYRIPEGVVTNCEILGDDCFCGISVGGSVSSRLLIENNLIVFGVAGLTLAFARMEESDALQNAVCTLRHNTIWAAYPLNHIYNISLDPAQFADPKKTRLRLEAAGNILAGQVPFGFPVFDESIALKDAVPLLPKLMSFQDEDNLYAVRENAFLRLVRAQGQDPFQTIKSLQEWHELWGIAKSSSQVGTPVFAGGHVFAKALADPGDVSPTDFRLAPGSPGKGAGPDGKDLGADVDLVGPGPAYERWKKTPEYQQWLKDTGQFKAEAPKPEAKAFALMGGKGIEVGKFDTLAEAVQNASDGDTIEVRGNGPFVTEPVSIGKRSLTIRAATGFRPVIKGNAGRIGEGVTYLLHSQGPLVLEGLELHMTGAFNSRIVFSVLGPLHVANCRFVLSGFHSVSAADTLVCTVRNCEFVGTSGGARNHVISALRNNGKLTLENNLLSSPGGNALGIFLGRPDLHNVTFHLKHNTLATPSEPIIHGLMFVPESAEPGAPPGRQPVQMTFSENLFELIGVQERIFSLLLAPDWYRKDAKPLSATEAEQLLPRLLAWREERNLYCKDLTFLAMRRMKDQIGPERAFVDEPLPAGRTLADWQRMWNTGDSGSVQGVIRYEGGDVRAKMAATPELITAADFRLRPDSAGYKAGPDGKDLGADVDQVGPGPAYERWKKTPEYQQWLKDTGQSSGQQTAEPRKARAFAVPARYHTSPLKAKEIAMSWPMSQDYNESIQSPAACFADPELKQGQAVCNAMGLPVPCSGNFADVYALQTPQRKWAIKCFTREIPGIRERYVEISKFLQQLKLPFMVEFKFLEQGMRIRGQWYPVLKMHWVEGFTLNHCVRQQLDKPPVLNSLCQMWLKMAVRLRQGQLAHCDLQHGNVLMVPGAKAGMLSLRLVDYDGMCVPALELLKPIEVGHPNFQHPQRLQEGTYNVEVDRFSHLVIYTALRALAVGGKGLWDKFDNGDNLLFKKADLLDPAGSPLFAELLALPDPEVHKLAEALAAAAQKPLEQTPFLEELVNGQAAPAVKKPVTAGSKPAAAPAGDIVQAERKGQHKESAAAKQVGNSKLAWIAVGGGAAVLALAAGVFFLVAGGQKAPPTAPAFAKGPTQSQPAFRPESTTTNAEPKVEPKVEAKVEPKVEAKVEPKVEAKVEPKVEAKVEPKVEAKVEPKVEAKVEPKVEAKVEPKVEPKVEAKVEPKVERLPVPEAGDIARADKFVKELFKVDYARRGAADRLALAKQLLQQGSTTKEDAAARFVCYREARDLAVGVPEPALAVTAIDALAREFNVDDLELKTAALEQIARATGTPGSNKALFDTATALIEPALARDQHDLAVSLAKAAQFGAVRGKLPSLVTAAAGASVREVEALKRDFAAVQAASAILLTMPDDPAANRLVGKHHFFIRGDAPQGLPLLAKSDDAKLKALAARDLAGTKDPREQMAIGDAWHDVAENETGIAKRHGQRRAALWYQQALPALTGLDQTKVQRRLQALGGIVSAAPVGPAKLEAPPMPVTTKDEKGAFVLVLGGKDRKFDTLAEAVQAARDGDTITVHGNGPFVSEPITIARPLAIRAGAGYRPVIKISPEVVQSDRPLITTTAALVLEGLELHREPPAGQSRWAVTTNQAPLLAANCRFRAGISVSQSPGCVFRNCEFLVKQTLYAGQYRPGARVLFDNCLFWTNWTAITAYHPDAALHDVSIQVKRGTFVCGPSLNLVLQSPLPAAGRPAIRLDVSGSIFDSSNVLMFVQGVPFLAKSAELGPAEAEAALPRLLAWRGERNLFAAGTAGRAYVTWSIKWERNQPPHGPKNLAEWNQFWKAAETDSLEGLPRFQGGDLRSRGDALDHLTPADFRLRSDSPGYRAGKDGKDLGADVDLVGPGAAYERWKKTPEYQQWLKDPGQMK